MSDASSPSMLTRRVLIPFVVATVIWGSTWIVIRDQLGIVPAAWSIAYRFFIGSAAMFIWATTTGAPKTLPREGHIYAALLGGTLFCLNIENIRQFFSWLSGTTLFNPEFYFLSRLPAEIQVDEVVTVVAMALGLSLLATLFPSWRASKLDPVEALRYE